MKVIATYNLKGGDIGEVDRTCGFTDAAFQIVGSNDFHGSGAWNSASRAAW